MRFNPKSKYHDKPCSYVGTGCAYEDYFGWPFLAGLPENLRADGWSSLDNTNKYVRKHLPVRKKVYFKRGTRPLLRDFLKDNEEKCLICVYGHFVYAKGRDYWSFFDNDNDEIVCIWFLKEKNHE